MSQRDPVRTTPTLEAYVGAVVRAWPSAEPSAPCSREACAVLWAQYMIETGGRACWNWNIGNVKAADLSRPWHALRGVWEGVSAAEASRLVAAGEAVYDASAAHQRAVAPRTAVVFEPPHPATRFRSFDSLDDAMGEHLALLRRRFARGWPGVLAGDVVAFARGLRAQGYFTASAEAYAAGMRAPFAAAMASDAFGIAIDPRPEVDMGGPVHGTHVVDAALAERDELEPVG